MVLEATMICIDNSEWSRNEDFTPTRLEAQQDTANLLCGTKTQMNPENAVGLLVMGSPRVSVVVAPTCDMGAFLQALHGLASTGVSDFVRGVQTAQLALKHRLNRNQRQRIVLFVCSPIEATEKQLEQLGKSLKKNNISLDIISFGEVPENSNLLQKLYQSANSNDTSHLVEVLDASPILTRQVRESLIVSGEGGGVSASSNLDDFGVDPNTDPELFMALRLSLEEERARNRRTRDPEAPESAPETAIAATQASVDEPAHVSPSVIPATSEIGVEAASEDAPNNERLPTVDEINAMSIDPELRQALLLSLKDFSTEETEGKSTNEVHTTTKRHPDPISNEVSSTQSASQRAGENKRRKTDGSISSVEFKTPQSARSELSVQDAGEGGEGQTSGTAGETHNTEEEMMARVARSLAGVNLDNPQVRAALRSLPSYQQTDEKSKDVDGKKEKE